MKKEYDSLLQEYQNQLGKRKARLRPLALEKDY